MIFLHCQETLRKTTSILVCSPENSIASTYWQVLTIMAYHIHDCRKKNFMAELLALIGIFGRAFSKCIMYSIDGDELCSVLYSG